MLANVSIVDGIHDDPVKSEIYYFTVYEISTPIFVEDSRASRFFLRNDN